jgi:cyclase
VYLNLLRRYAKKVSEIDIPYVHGLADLGDGCFAWLEPPGSWGLANSGIVTGPDDVLVVDTQNDMRLARALRDAVDSAGHHTQVSTVVNTHGDSDHWSGNTLFDQARVISSDATLDEMTHMWLNQERLAELSRGDSPFARWIRWRRRTFDYRDWRPAYPNQTFTGVLSIEAAGRPVRLTEVGPAHTAGDIIVYLPSDGVLYAGDIIFTDSTPMVWAGPVSRCIAACDHILSLGPRVIVPGHGPVTGQDGVRRMREYLRFVDDYATTAHAAGRSPDQAYAEIKLGEYAEWPHASRVYHTIRVIYRDLDPERYPVDRIGALGTVLADDDGTWKSRDE